MKLSPQTACMIETLLSHDHTSRELMIEVGCNNPADIIQHLRKDNNLKIDCELVPTKNRYGKKVYIGLYSIPEKERGKAIRLLDGAVTPSNNTVDNLAKKPTESGSIAQHDTVGGVV